MIINVNWQAASGESLAHISNGTAQWVADISPAAGGNGKAPDPHDLLDSALGACTVLTLQMYAQRRGYALADIAVSVTRHEEDGVYRLQRQITLGGNLDDAARADLLRVAEKCPIHKALSGRFEIATELVG
ncbi:OsmC family protein [Silvimonas sp.]|uniref:OsmC family protein n=1 Tax=Silvimonas sp. TaxID=2650811 RepID=UPI002845543B|nr:OsmC family protein [Silvimonas sp.]MDR3429563.1 OsmC family protein [Silvimonas sp.]